MKNILVAINKEQNAGRLLSKAEELAEVFGSKIWILHVSEADPDDFLGLEAGPQFAHEKRLQNRKKEGELIKRLAEDLQARNFEAEGMQLQGSTAKLIKAQVKELNADLLIAGHHQRNFFYQLFVGNMEQEIIEDLKVPVLLVPVDH